MSATKESMNPSRTSNVPANISANVSANVSSHSASPSASASANVSCHNASALASTNAPSSSSDTKIDFDYFLSELQTGHPSNPTSTCSTRFEDNRMIFTKPLLDSIKTFPKWLEDNFASALRALAARNDFGNFSYLVRKFHEHRSEAEFIDFLRQQIDTDFFEHCTCTSLLIFTTLKQYHSSYAYTHSNFPIWHFLINEANLDPKILWDPSQHLSIPQCLILYRSFDFFRRVKPLHSLQKKSRQQKSSEINPLALSPETKAILDKPINDIENIFTLFFTNGCDIHYCDKLGRDLLSLCIIEQKGLPLALKLGANPLLKRNITVKKSSEMSIVTTALGAALKTWSGGKVNRDPRYIRKGGKQELVGTYCYVDDLTVLFEYGAGCGLKTLRKPQNLSPFCYQSVDKHTDAECIEGFAEGCIANDHRYYRKKGEYSKIYFLEFCENIQNADIVMVGYSPEDKDKENPIWCMVPKNALAALLRDSDIRFPHLIYICKHVLMASDEEVLPSVKTIFYEYAMQFLNTKPAMQNAKADDNNSPAPPLLLSSSNDTKQNKDNALEKVQVKTVQRNNM